MLSQLQFRIVACGVLYCLASTQCSCAWGISSISNRLRSTPASLTTTASKDPTRSSQILTLPEEFYNGVARPGSWCERASKLAGQNCHLFSEDDRHLLSVYISNCHLEAAGRPEIAWSHEFKLRDAPEADVTLVMYTIAQLETVCMNLGVAWQQAFSTEQAIHLSDLSAKIEHLLAVRDSLESTSAKFEMSSNAVVESAEKIQNLQGSIHQQATQIVELTTEFSKRAENLRNLSRQAEQSRKESELALSVLLSKAQGALDRFPQSAKNISDVLQPFTNIFHSLKKESNVEQLMGGHMLIGTAGLAWGCQILGKGKLLFQLASFLGVVKAVADSPILNRYIREYKFWSLPALLLFVVRVILSIIPYSNLAICAALGYLWHLAPDTTRLLLGTTSRARFNPVRCQPIRTATVKTIQRELKDLRDDFKQGYSHIHTALLRIQNRDNGMSDMESEVVTERNKNMQRTISQRVASFEVESLKEQLALAKQHILTLQTQLVNEKKEQEADTTHALRLRDITRYSTATNAKFSHDNLKNVSANINTACMDTQTKESPTHWASLPRANRDDDEENIGSAASSREQKSNPTTRKPLMSASRTRTRQFPNSEGTLEQDLTTNLEQASHEARRRLRPRTRSTCAR